MEIKPDYLDAHFSLGLALAGHGRVDEALKHYQKALELAFSRNDMSLVNAIRAKMTLLGGGDR